MNDIPHDLVIRFPDEELLRKFSAWLLDNGTLQFNSEFIDDPSYYMLSSPDDEPFIEVHVLHLHTAII